MTMIESQEACLASDAAYSAYFHRFFSVRAKDGSIRVVEDVTQEVLRELVRLQRTWENTQPAGTVARAS